MSNYNNFCNIFLLQFILGFILLNYVGCSARILGRFKRIADELRPTTTESVPYMVSVYESGANASKYFICSGTLLARDLVLTAAHCLSNLSVQSMTVQESPYSGAAQVDQRKVAEILKPQEYSESFKDLDMALLLLDTPFSINNPHIRPIKLCDSDIRTDESLQVSLWGRALSNVTYMNWRQCAQHFANQLKITPNMFCGDPEKEESLCSRDAGGPVVQNGKLCGIVLYGSGWIEPKNPGVYLSIEPIKRLITYAMTGSS